MDKCTHEVRKQRWKNIIGQCLQRPEGMTAKQWLDENNICEQTYYHWLKRIRQETYELATASANTACVKQCPEKLHLRKFRYRPWNLLRQVQMDFGRISPYRPAPFSLVFQTPHPMRCSVSCLR